MQVLNKKKELLSALDNFRKEGKSIGLVPTMGALHKGHLSLVEKSNKDNNITIISIFVNPTQFNDKSDLKNYPRTLNNDVKFIKTSGFCDIIFAPSVEEIYPEPDNREFNLGYVSTVMEGARRPGHFNGVAQIVSKLLYLVKPNKAYFGMKDFQQIAVIKSMVKLLSIDVDIVSCPIIREIDGLALSSRNRLLTYEHRKNAPIIHQTLVDAAKKSSTLNVEDLKSFITNKINENTYLEVEYVEIVEQESLKIILDLKEKSSKVICIAVQAGNIRLIDNMVI